MSAGFVTALICLVVLIASQAGCTNRENAKSAKEDAAKAPVNEELTKVQGVWEGEDKNGQLFAFLVEGDSVLVLPQERGQDVLKVELSPEKSPKQFKLSPRDTKDPQLNNTLWGSYELTGTKLKVALSPASDPIPVAFTDDNTLTFDLKGKSVNLAPEDSNYVRGLATWNYWRKLDSVIKSHRSVGEILKGAKTSDQIISAVRDVASEADKIGSEISSLPVTNVDPEATAYASLLVGMFGKIETAYNDLANLFVEIKEFKEYKGSDQVVGEAIIRLLAGDPLGTYNDLNAQERVFQERARQIQDRLKAGIDPGDLEAQQLKTRSSLSQKYNREFKKQ